MKHFSSSPRFFNFKHDVTYRNCQIDVKIVIFAEIRPFINIFLSSLSQRKP